MSSKFSGRPINPPDANTKRRFVPSTEEEREFAYYLHTEGGLHGEWRAIARRLFRKFGHDRSGRQVQQWVKTLEESKTK